MTPTQRALAVCREQGWTAGIVEKWNPHARIRQDLFGCIDLIVADEREGILGVQVTSGANVSARLAKAKAEPRLVKWLSSGGRFEVWGFRKLAKRKADGKKSKVKEYVLRRIEIYQTWIDADPLGHRDVASPDAVKDLAETIHRSAEGMATHWLNEKTDIYRSVEDWRRAVALGATESDPAGVLEAVALDGVPTQEKASGGVQA